MEILATQDQKWARQCEACLLALSVPTEWKRESSGAFVLSVDPDYVELASIYLSEYFAENQFEPVSDVKTSASQTPIFWRPEMATAIGFSLSLLAFFGVSGSFWGESEFMRRGALYSASVFAADEWWRVVTAATLHADWPHVIGNAAFLIVLLWAAGERMGSGVAVFLWLLSAVGGFFTSLLISGVAITVGASGGVFGLLGAAAGHGGRWEQKGRVRSFRMRAVGAAIMLTAFTAFGERANLSAHLGGFVVGLSSGWLMPEKPFSRPVQWVMAFFVVLIVGGSWAFAFDLKL
ncbi:rhomboid family intramembrane serine protease [Myxococcota bacterium]|nr:rhomboid family intramembrane serine protease [Myxococcota bacterium]